MEPRAGSCYRAGQGGEETAREEVDVRMHESKPGRRGLSRWVLGLAILLMIALGSVGSSEAAQSCGDLGEPQDMPTVSSPSQMPSVYLARINAGDPEHVTNLFAPDGVHRGPDGQIRRGRAAILEFYKGILGSGPRKLAVGRSVADDHRVAFELINVQQPCNEDDPALAVDLMDINEDGQIQQFTVFSRPRPQ